MWAARPGEGRYAHRGPAGRPSTPYSGPTVRPEELATGYFAGQVQVPGVPRVTPRGIAWAVALFAFQCAGIRLVLGYPGLDGPPAANDRVVSAWLPLFLLACAAAPLVAVALAAGRRPPDRFGADDGAEPFGHPTGVSVLTGAAVAPAAVAVLAFAARGAPHAAPGIAVGCGAVLAVALGAAAGLLAAHRPALRTPVCWGVLAVWVGLVVRHGFVWAAAPELLGPDGAGHAARVVAAYAPAVLAAGVAATAVIGGVSGFVRTGGQAPLLATVAGLWAVAIATAAVGLGPAALTTAPWPDVAWTLTGAIVGVVAVLARSWWRAHR